MLILIWLLAGLSLGNCENVSSQIEQSINRTIETVEQIVQNDPSLPRLSRQDILKILQNITTGNEEFAKIEKMTKDAYQRALMVVLPQSTNKEQKAINEIYTKAPLIQMIPDSEEADSIVEVGKTEEIVFPPNPKDPTPFGENKDKWEAKQSVIVPTTSNIKIECNTDWTQNSSKIQNIKPISEPEKFSFNLANLEQITKSAKEYIESGKYRNSKDDSDNKASNSNKVAVVYGTNFNPKKSNNNSSGLNESQLKDLASNLGLHHWHFMRPPLADNANSAKTISNTEKYKFPLDFAGNVKSYFEIPKKVIGSYSNNEEDRPAPVYVTPLSSAPEKTTIEKETTLNNNMPGFSIATKIETSVKPLDILNSALQTHTKVNNEKKTSNGMMDSNQEEGSSSTFNLPLNLEKYSSSKVNEEKLASTLMSFYDSEAQTDSYGNIYKNKQTKNNRFNEPVGLLSYDDSSAVMKQSPIDNFPVNFRKGVQNLSPNVRLLFQQFGLQPTFKEMLLEKAKVTTTTKKPTTIASYLEKYSNFKRLPSSSVENKEMRDFLAQFGLGSIDTRNRKSMKTDDYMIKPDNYMKIKQTKRKPSTFDMRKALNNVGLIALAPRSDEIIAQPTSNYEVTNVFKPHESSNSEEQRQQIHKLLNTIKMVQDGKVEDVQKVVADLVQTTKNLKNGPDPVTLDEILKIYKEEVKNEKKHQRQAIYDQKDDVSSTSIETTSGEVTSTESIETTPMTSSTAKGSFFDNFNLNIPMAPTDSDSKPAEQPNNFAALEESFGGSTSAPDPVLPTKPRSGLYFLVDWNTFLEVGEDGKDKVNLRFEPKVGDRSRFIPIKIP